MISWQASAASGLLFTVAMKPVLAERVNPKRPLGSRPAKRGFPGGGSLRGGAATAAVEHGQHPITQIEADGADTPAVCRRRPRVPSGGCLGGTRRLTFRSRQRERNLVLIPFAEFHAEFSGFELLEFHTWNARITNGVASRDSPAAAVCEGGCDSRRRTRPTSDYLHRGGWRGHPRSLPPPPSGYIRQVRRTHVPGNF